MTDESGSDDIGHDNLIAHRFALFGLVFLLLVTFLIPAVHILGILFPQIGFAGDWAVVSSGLSALATLILASVTYLALQQSERQNRRLQKQVKIQEERLDEYKKQGERPIVIDALQQILKPSLRNLESNLDRLENIGGGSDKGLGWKPKSEPSSIEGSTEIRLLAQLDEVDDATVGWLNEHYPELVSLIGDYNEAVFEFEETINEVAESIRIPISKEYRAGSYDNILEKEEEFIPDSMDEVEWLVTKVINKEDWSQDRGMMLPSLTLEEYEGNHHGIFSLSTYGREDTAEDYRDALEEMIDISQDSKEELTTTVAEIQKDFNVPQGELNRS